MDRELVGVALRVLAALTTRRPPLDVDVQMLLATATDESPTELDALARYIIRREFGRTGS